jgi:hypothetical protein
VRPEAAQELAVRDERPLGPAGRAGRKRQQQRCCAVRRKRPVVGAPGDGVGERRIDRDAADPSDRRRVALDQDRGGAKAQRQRRLLRVRPAPVHRQRDGAEPRRGVEREHVLRRVPERDAEDLAGREAERLQMRRPASHQAVELAIVNGPRAADQGRAVGPRPHVVCQRVREVHHGVPAGNL